MTGSRGQHGLEGRWGALRQECVRWSLSPPCWERGCTKHLLQRTAGRRDRTFACPCGTQVVDGRQYPPNGSLLDLQDAQKLHGTPELGKRGCRLLLVFRLREGREKQAITVERLEFTAQNRGRPVGAHGPFMAAVNYPRLSRAGFGSHIQTSGKAVNVICICFGVQGRFYSFLEGFIGSLICTELWSGYHDKEARAQPWSLSRQKRREHKNSAGSGELCGGPQV